MGVLIAQLSGLGIFVVLTMVLGSRVRRAASTVEAETLSRYSHLAFWIGLILPWTVGVFYPGGTALDDIFGLQALPVPTVVRYVAGVAMVAIGVVLMQLSINGLKRHGGGAPALKLTQSIVDTGVYAWCRNPMALGFYIGLLGGALLAGSTYVAVYTAGIIAAHVFNLKYFEEVELARRYGDSYARYRESTPFLVPRTSKRSVRT